MTSVSVGLRVEKLYPDASSRQHCALRVENQSAASCLSAMGRARRDDLALAADSLCITDKYWSGILPELSDPLPTVGLDPTTK